MFSRPKDENDMKTSRPATPAPAGKSANGLSTFGHGMQITGNVVCPGALQIFGRITGEIHAAHLTVGEGARVEGKITAQETIVQGAFNGTIHGNFVKLERHGGGRRRDLQQVADDRAGRAVRRRRPPARRRGRSAERRSSRRAGTDAGDLGRRSRGIERSLPPERRGRRLRRRAGVPRRREQRGEIAERAQQRDAEAHRPVGVEGDA